MEPGKAEEASAVAGTDMELEPENGAAAPSTALTNGTGEPRVNGVSKRERAEGGEDEDVSKRQKMETSVEEQRLEKAKEGEAEEEVGDGAEETEKDDNDDGKPVKLGPKSFTSSLDMFEYFYRLLHKWSPKLDMNKFESMVLLELIQKGHTEPDKKIGAGIQTFQVRYHPQWKSRCFFLVRIDGSVDDFSFRKCVDHLLPLPENLRVPDGKKGGGHQRGGGCGGRGKGRARGGRGKRGNRS